MHQFCKLYLSPSDEKMNKASTRALYSFIFLALAQIACGPTIKYNAGFFVYEDLNGYGQQDSGETGLQNVPIQYMNSRFSTNSEVKGKGSGEGAFCPPTNLKVTGYSITEFSIPAWDCRTLVKENELIPTTYYRNNVQQGNYTIGMVPLNWMTKTASPTTFSGPNETISYSYFISNPMNKALLKIMVVDDKLGIVSCGGLNTINIGGSLTCGSSYTTTEEDVARGFITNTATFEFSDDSGGVFTSAPVSATVTLDEVQVLVGEQPAPPILLDPVPVFTSAVLTGEVYTLCDTVNRPVNLKLVAGTDNTLVTQELANGNLKILIAKTDISKTCQVNPSNTALLTCTYPASLTSLPAEGQVLYKTIVLQTFRFDGENGCQPPPSNNSSGGDTSNGNPPAPEAPPSSGGDTSNGNPPATEPPPNEPPACDPNEPGTSCFCEENPFDESCATQD